MPFDSRAYLSAMGQAAGNIQGIGATIAGGIKNWQQEKKEDKAARAVFDALDPEDSDESGRAPHPFGITKDELDGMSRADRIAFVGGKVQSLSVKQHMAQMEREQAEEQRRQEDQTDQQLQRTAQAEFQRRLSPMQPFEQGPQQAMTPDRVLGEAAAAGYRLPPQMLQQMMQEQEGVNWQDVMPRPFEIEGVKGAVGKSGQFQFLPQATPESLQAVPVTDADGNIVGMRVPTGKGGTAPLPASKPKTLPDSYNTRLNTIMEGLESIQGTISKTDDELKSIYRGQDPAKLRAAKSAELERQKKTLRDHVSRFKEQGYGDEPFWKGEMERLGLSASPAATPAAADRITVIKDGKQFTVPASQLAEAEKQGYKRAP